MLAIVGFELFAGFLDGIGIEPVAHFEVGLVQELIVQLGLDADDEDFLDYRPLDDLEDHRHAAGNLLHLGAYVDEAAAFDELLDVVLDRAGIVGLPLSGFHRRQRARVLGSIALHFNIDHQRLAGASCGGAVRISGDGSAVEGCASTGIRREPLRSAEARRAELRRGRWHRDIGRRLRQ